MAAWPDLSYIRTEVRYHLDETTASLWADAELNRHINDAQRDSAAKTGCYVSITSAVTTASSRLVPFVGHKVQYAEYLPAGSAPIGLIFITPKMLGNVPINDGLVPQYCFQWGQNLIIEPMPQAAYNLNLYVAEWPAYDMSEATDEPLIPMEFHNTLPFYAVSMAMLKAKRPMTSAMFYKTYTSVSEACKRIYVESRPDLLKDTKLPDIVQEPQNVEQTGP